MADLKTIGVHHDILTHTSDHFDLILKYATQMLERDLAYIDNTPVEQMRAWRMTGVASPGRTATLAENLRLWNEMQLGSPEGLACCMRAKIDMSANNKTMRDPTMYRCNITTPHHRTGTKYKVYPTYDFACPIVDSIEGVTIVLRTDEYRDRNEQFYWMIDALGLRKPFIRDYSRLNFVYTLLSKRKLQWFVDTGKVDGWNDARFPTIQGILRRGMQVEALREFMIGQGFSMSANTMEWDKIWTINKRIIDPIAPRYTGITAEHQAVLEIDNLPDSELVAVDLHPKNAAIGRKVVSRSNRVVLEQDDAKLIKDGEEVRTHTYTHTHTHARALPHPPSLTSHRIMMNNRLWFSDFIHDDTLIR
jgi:glutamyl/glutaminyl-tRNA synthetase